MRPDGFGDLCMSSQHRKEWSGESGYCNCLLVTMCRLGISTITLSSDRKVPNLEELAGERSDTLAWICAQQFDYSALSSRVVVETLFRSAGISWLKRKGRIQAYDVVGNDGPTVQRTFYLQKIPWSGATALSVQLEGLEPTPV
jgi:hypothetical protein